MHPYTEIRKRDSQRKNGVEHTQTNSSQVVMEQPSCDRLKGSLRDNTPTVRAAIGVDGSGTRGLGLRCGKGDGGECYEEIH